MVDSDNQRSIWSNRDDLRPIEEIPQPYQQIFMNYPSFNVVQSKVFDDVFYTDTSLVVAAPTGAGKTTIFELAIVRLLMFHNTPDQFNDQFKIVYVAPMKAICEERLVDWHRKFAKFGVNCLSVTGDSDFVDFYSLINHNLIITTPEKWDSLTRKWKDNLKVVQMIKLFMIDEVHLLDEDVRGSSLEMVVCRMKAIEQSARSGLENQDEDKIRFVAVSATLSNIEDVRDWIGNFSTVKHYKFSDEFRPVKLLKIVIGYQFDPKSTPFRFDLSLNYKIEALLRQYSKGKPTLIFCCTRKVAEMTAKHLVQHLTITLNPEQKAKLVEATASIDYASVKVGLVHGIGFHHAGLLVEHRRIIENLFRNGDLPILVTTSTLAMGINLPAHLVIVKSTKCYSNGEYKDLTETAIMQMIGRAGRPQFDTEATALILTTLRDKPKFERMVSGLKPIESNLHRHLTEHLNAEIVLRTITDLNVAMKWISTTFLFIRARKNPHNYGISKTNTKDIDRKLLEMCEIVINRLVSAGMVVIDDGEMLQPTAVGELMAKYYLAFETIKLFTQLNGDEILQQILILISKCQEFSELYLRVNDKKCLNGLSKSKIRFRLNGPIKTLDMKIICIIQAVLDCLDIYDPSIVTEALKVMRNGERIAKCLVEYLETRENAFRALLSTITLAKCLHAKLWENSPFVSKQLQGIGAVLSGQFAKAGKTTFELITQCSAMEIETIIAKKPPTGARILQQVKHLPKYTIKIEQVYDQKKGGNFLLSLCLENVADVQVESSVDVNAIMHLIVGDSSNRVLLYEKYAHSYMLENPEVLRFIEIDLKDLEGVEAHFISEDWVGFDCKSIVKLGKRKEDEQVIEEAKQKKKTNYMQTFMDMYMQVKGKNDSFKTDSKTVANKHEDEKSNSSKKIVVHKNILLKSSANAAHKAEILPEVVAKKKHSFDSLEDAIEFLEEENCFFGENLEPEPTSEVGQKEEVHNKKKDNFTIEKKEPTCYKFNPLSFSHDPTEAMTSPKNQETKEFSETVKKKATVEDSFDYNKIETVLVKPDNNCELKLKKNEDISRYFGKRPSTPFRPPTLKENQTPSNPTTPKIPANPSYKELQQPCYKFKPEAFKKDTKKFTHNPSEAKTASITWRSPVAAFNSPPVKFSPHPNHKSQYNLGFTPNERQNAKTEPELKLIPLLALNDLSYNHSGRCAPESSEKLDELSDFVSDNFLNDLKMKRPKMHDLANSTVSGSGSYYASMMRQNGDLAKKARSEVKTPFCFRKPILTGLETPNTYPSINREVLAPRARYEQNNSTRNNRHSNFTASDSGFIDRNKTPSQNQYNCNESQQLMSDLSPIWPEEDECYNDFSNTLNKMNYENNSFNDQELDDENLESVSQVCENRYNRINEDVQSDSYAYLRQTMDSGPAPFDINPYQRRFYNATPHRVRNNYDQRAYHSQSYPYYRPNYQYAAPERCLSQENLQRYPPADNYILNRYFQEMKQRNTDFY